MSANGNGTGSGNGNRNPWVEYQLRDILELHAPKSVEKFLVLLQELQAERDASHPEHLFSFRYGNWLIVLQNEDKRNMSWLLLFDADRGTYRIHRIKRREKQNKETGGFADASPKLQP